MINAGRTQNLKQEASHIGKRLLFLSHHPLVFLSATERKTLRDAARALHLTETVQLMIDGGLSQQAVANRVRRTTEQLESVAVGLQ